MIDPTTEIYEDGEYCEVCGTTEQLGRWGHGKKAEPLVFTVCQTCYDDPAKFRDWLAAQFEAALEADPTMMKLPNGKWTTRPQTLPSDS